MHSSLSDICQAAENGQNILLHGPGGTGKTYTLEQITRRLHSKGKKISCTATTGIAAINLSIPEIQIAGCTLHSWAGVGLGDKPPEKLLAMVSHDERARRRWRETDILIVDEVSMLGAEFLDKLDFVGRNIRREKTVPFGGLQVIFSGDFLQLPPVNAKWAFESYVWKEMSQGLLGKLFPIILEEPKRYEDVNWFNLLLRIRKGEPSTKDIHFLHTRVRAYEDWLKNPVSSDLTTVKPTMLHSKKVDVEQQNNRELEKLPGMPTNFISDDAFTPFNTRARFDHYMKPLDDAIPQCICLNIGAQVMLKANLDIAGGLANGSRGVVINIIKTGEEAGVKVKWMNGKITTVTKHTWKQEDKDGQASRTQIPLILAWCLTIHKSQGATLDYAICNLGPSVFLEGQAYVALSRVRSSNGLFLTEFYPPSVKASSAALNYILSIENMKEADICNEKVGYDSPKSPQKSKFNFINREKIYWVRLCHDEEYYWDFPEEECEGCIELSRFGGKDDEKGVGLLNREYLEMSKADFDPEIHDIFATWKELWCLKRTYHNNEDE